MDFIENRKKFFSISIVVIIIGLLAMPLNAALGNGILNYDIEFQGGTLMQVNIGKPFDINEDIKPMVIETTGDVTPQITKVTGKDEVVIKLTETTPEQRTALFDALKAKYDLDDTEQLNVRDVSPTISGEMKTKAVQAMIIASILMLIYITIRFKNGYMGASAVIALIHDVLVVLMIYTVFRIPVNNSFIIVMLTLLGYSINDTIVIFDRIRENKSRVRMSDKDVINLSIKQTLARTINSSITTIIVVLLLYIFGTSSVKEFALPLTVGIAVGTYSSICIASQTWYQLTTMKK